MKKDNYGPDNFENFMDPLFLFVIQTYLLSKSGTLDISYKYLTQI